MAITIFTRIGGLGMSRWKWIGRPAVVALYVLAVTYMAGKWAIHYAYLERGYDAIGGEYLFIPMVAWAAYKLINKIYDGSVQGAA